MSLTTQQNSDHDGSVGIEVSAYPYQQTNTHMLARAHRHMQHARTHTDTRTHTTQQHLMTAV